MQALFPTLVYFLCFATSAACAWLLCRGYGRTGARLLLWSGLCFVFLAANNLLVMIDMLLVPQTDLRMGRLLLALVAVAILLYGCIWDLEEE